MLGTGLLRDGTSTEKESRQRCSVDGDAGAAFLRKNRGGLGSIVANRPEMAGTVPDIWALSRRCPVEAKYQQCPGIYAHLALPLA